jgi:hypothetical protein
MNPAVVLPFVDYHSPKSVPRIRHDGPISNNGVKMQLARILKSEGFVRAKRMRRFLEFVVEETLAGRANQLCEYSIALSVFQRHESFEPGLDPIVRNDARRLRQKLLEYYQRSRSKSDAQILIDIPRGTYVPVFSLISPPNAVKTAPQYRLSVRLIRIADNAEIWAAEEELQFTGHSDGHCFALQFEMKNQAPPLAMLPISRSSNRAHRSNRSLEREVR